MIITSQIFSCYQNTWNQWPNYFDLQLLSVSYNPLVTSYFKKNPPACLWGFGGFFLRKDANDLRPETGTDNVTPGCWFHSDECSTIRKTSPSFHRYSQAEKRISYGQNNKSGLLSQLDCADRVQGCASGQAIVILILSAISSSLLYSFLHHSVTANKQPVS